MKTKEEITDDIIRNKFYEILGSKDTEEQQIMGFNNIDKITRHELLRESFVQEVKNLINDTYSNYCSDPLNAAYRKAYFKTSKIAKDLVTAVCMAIKQGDTNLVEALLTQI